MAAQTADKLDKLNCVVEPPRINRGDLTSSVNGSTNQSKTKSAAKNGTGNGLSDHDESDDDKEDEVEVEGGQTVVTGGFFICSPATCTG